MKKALFFILLVLFSCVISLSLSEEKWGVKDSRLYFYPNGTRISTLDGPGKATIHGIEYEVSEEGYIRGNGNIQKFIYSLFTNYEFTAYYFIDDSDLVTTGWKTIGGKTYYFSPDSSNYGRAITGGGETVSNFKKIDDNYYYFDQEGVMITGLYYANSTYYGFGADGKQLFGWQEVDGNKYYFTSPTGSVARGWTKINDETFNFDGKGVLQTGLIVISDSLYYLDPDGKSQSGWKTIDGNTYYFSDNGYHPAEKGYKKIDSDYYYFDDETYVLKKDCFIEYNNDTFYFDDSGGKVVGWKDIGDFTYYFYSDDDYFSLFSVGEMVTGRMHIDNEYYYFDSDGHMITDKIADEYYYGDEGKQQSGWVEIDNDIYYFNPQMVTGQITIDNEDYLFNSDGHMLNGYQTIMNKTYNYGSDGKRQIGWHQKDNDWFYFNPAMAIGSEKIDNDYYLFDSDGHMLTGLQEIGKKKYYYDDTNGKRQTGWIEINENWYYFNPYAYADTKETIEGQSYRFNKDGTLHVHTVAIDPAVEATRLKSGLTEGSHCSVCGDILVAQTVTPPLDLKGPIFQYLRLPASFTYQGTGTNHFIYSSAIPSIVIKAFLSSDLRFTDQELLDSRRKIAELLQQTISVENHNGLQVIIKKDQESYTYKKPVYTVEFLDSGYLRTIEFHDLDNSKESNDLILRMIKSVSLNKLSPDYLGVSGWVQFAGNKWYYGDNNLNVVKGWQIIDRNQYLFNNEGLMITGWYSVNGIWYYFKDSGIMATGWVYDGSDWYYMNSDGSIAKGWIQGNGDWYYIQDSGKMFVGWLQSGNDWYYMNPSGSMVTGWLQSGNHWYYMDSNGTMHTGWLQLENDWYYFAESGKMATGWMQNGTTWYYFDINGAMVTGTQVINGTEYTFDASGAWVENTVPALTGWVQDGGAWYYYDDNSAIVTGWKKVSGTWYHFAKSGKMSTGWFEDKEAEAQLPAGQKQALWYWFDSSGKMATGWKEINGQWEMFAVSGLWLYTWDGT